MSESALRVATWNVAAINNNPFEYWITYENEPYQKLMQDVEAFIDAPGERDVTVSEVFTDEMYGTLRDLMEEEGWEGLDVVDRQWNEVYKNRTIVGGFLKDKDIGKKRLTSMPDRMTNTINTVRVNGEQSQVFRPTIINMYRTRWNSQQEWFLQWSEFMFRTLVTIRNKGKSSTKKVCQLLVPIKNAKYPAITPEEEAVSIPLQTVLLGVFDAILAHLMGQLAPDTWHNTKMELCEAFGEKKNARTMEIIETQYGGVDVLFMQEVAASFLNLFESSPAGEKFHVLRPEKMDASRDQNSVILLNKARFEKLEEVTDITGEVVDAAKAAGKVPLADGDLFVADIGLAGDVRMLLASFHGDTNGLATVPVLKAVHQLVSNGCANHKFIFGLDANTYETGNDQRQGVTEFAQEYTALGYSSCWGDTPDPKNYTTFNARTFLQPQLNKACRCGAMKDGADINPKDFILFRAAQFQSSAAFKDNTGTGTYLEDTVFPTINFPSDHAVVGCTLEDQEGGMCSIL